MYLLTAGSWGLFVPQHQRTSLARTPSPSIFLVSAVQISFCGGDVRKEKGCAWVRRRRMECNDPQLPTAPRTYDQLTYNYNCSCANYVGGALR